MKQVSPKFSEIRVQRGSYYDVRLVRGTTVYGMDKLDSIDIVQALFDESGPQIGGVFSAQCTVKLKEISENWPRMASFDVQIRAVLKDGSDQSEWVSFGTYYTDSRKKDKSGNLVLMAYDPMLLLEQSWTDKVSNLPSEWPITASAAAALLCEATGIQIDARTELDNTTPFIGLDTTSTAREVFSTIAAGLGGNWRITNEGKLLLVGCWDYMPSSSAIAGIAVAGLSIVGTTSDKAVTDSRGIYFLDKSVTSFETNDGLGNIANVELTTDNGTKIRKEGGDGSGYTLKGRCNFADSGIVNVCLERTYGYNYKPFEAQGARIDPSADAGDMVSIAGEYFQVAYIRWSIGKHIVADLSAPFEEMVDHEYSTYSGSAKTLQKAMGYTDNRIVEAASYFRQTEESIAAGLLAQYVTSDELTNALLNFQPAADVLAGYYSKDDVDALLAAESSNWTETANRFEATLNQFFATQGDQIETISYYIRYQVIDGVGTIIIAQTDNPELTVRITNREMSLWYNGVKKTYWNSERQYTPNELQIPVGGKFTLGSILFQPRSSGNMSLLWVG